MSLLQNDNQPSGSSVARSPEQLQKRIELLERKLSREKRARQHAENLLEDKSRALFNALRQSEQNKEKMQQLARTDPLTGLANRRELTRQFEQFTALNQRRFGQTTGLLMIDLNGFKPINDHWGHEAGDRILTTLAHRLQATARASDCVARIGGDEFAILCGQIEGPPYMAALASRIANVISQPIQIQDHQTICTASIGMSVSDDSSNLYELMRAADEAMYRNKRQHKAASRDLV